MYAGEVDLLNRNGLADLDTLRELDRSVGMEGDEAAMLFATLINEAKIMPLAVELGSKHSENIVKHVDSEHFVAQDGPANKISMLKKLHARFRPVEAKTEGEVALKSLKNFLGDTGLKVSGDSHEEINRTIRESMSKSGRIIYFPRGLTNNGQILADKIHFLPENLEKLMLAASAWNLIEESQQQYLAKAHAVHIGLSVGSELLFAGMNYGLVDVTLADPATLHTDAKSRLGEGYDRKFDGVNKAIYAMMQVYRKYPYAKVRLFSEGLTESNWDLVFRPSLAKSKKSVIAVEEADVWDAKWLTRFALRTYFTDWHNFMAADVGKRVILNTESPGDHPFHGYVGMLDPKGDDYGRNLPAGEENNLAKLVACIGGLEGFPEFLLDMIANGKIGKKQGAEISFVPQREATLLAASLYAEFLGIIASGGKTNKRSVVDIAQFVGKDVGDNSEQELELARALNNKFFGRESF